MILFSVKILAWIVAQFCLCGNRSHKMILNPSRKLFLLSFVQGRPNSQQLVLGRAGLTAVAVDQHSNRHRPHHHVMNLDLSDEGSWQLLRRICETHDVIWVHILHLLVVLPAVLEIVLFLRHGLAPGLYDQHSFLWDYRDFTGQIWSVCNLPIVFICWQLIFAHGYPTGILTGQWRTLDVLICGSCRALFDFVLWLYFTILTVACMVVNEQNLRAFSPRLRLWERYVYDAMVPTTICHGEYCRMALFLLLLRLNTLLCCALA